MEIRIAEFTVRAAFPDIPPVAAVIVTVPTVTPVARPEAFTVATAGFEEDQATSAVMLKLVPSE